MATPTVTEIVEQLSFTTRAWLMAGAVGAAVPAVTRELAARGLGESDGSAVRLTTLGREVRARLLGRSVRATPAKAALTSGRPRLEKHEQAEAEKLFASLGGTVYRLGTRRPRGRACPKCGTFVAEHQGTCQTSGRSDLVGFLPRRGTAAQIVVFVEMKSAAGRLSPEQQAFRDLCAAAGVAHVAGTVDVVIAWLIEQGFVHGESLANYRRRVE